MTEDLSASISAMRHVVAVMRGSETVPAEDRDRLVEILEQQISEMEQRQGERA